MIIFNYGTVVDPLLRDIRELTPRFSGMKPGDMVLDVCCGTGAQVLEYGRHGIVAMGLDIDPRMLKIAGRKKVKQRADNVSFQLADAANLPFADNCFDYVSVCFGLHDKEGEIRNKVVSEMRRVVKQQGGLIFIDFWVPLPRNVWAGIAKTIECLVGGCHYRGFKDYLVSGGLDSLLKTYGLVEECRAYLKNGLIVIIKAGKDF
jgi:ubiquinone/menaquinone biosynthesis C-methylase UbiE